MLQESMDMCGTRKGRGGGRLSVSLMTTLRYGRFSISFSPSFLFGVMVILSSA
jgi:hypothetical protein